jgi:hypothetical protein
MSAFLSLNIQSSLASVGITSNARVIRVIQCIGVKADVEGRLGVAS